MKATVPRKRWIPGAIVLWLLAIGWVCVIFFFSGQDGVSSSNLSYRVARLVSRLLNGQVSADRIHPFLRKLAHFGIFAVEGFLLTLALCATWRRTFLSASLALSACAAMACLNELHQRFSEGRVCSLRDVLIDSSGALAGILVACGIVALLQSIWRKRTQKFI